MSFGVVDEVEEEIVMKPEMVDKAVWTNEPEFSTYFAMRVFRPMEIKGFVWIAPPNSNSLKFVENYSSKWLEFVSDDNNEDLSCSLSFGGTSVKTGVLPLQSSQPEKIVEEAPPDIEGT